LEGSLASLLDPLVYWSIEEEDEHKGRYLKTKGDPVDIFPGALCQNHLRYMMSTIFRRSALL
jgi:hypothetical protein